MYNVIGNTHFIVLIVLKLYKLQIKNYYTVHHLLIILYSNAIY